MAGASDGRIAAPYAGSARSAVAGPVAIGPRWAGPVSARAARARRAPPGPAAPRRGRHRAMIRRSGHIGRLRWWRGKRAAERQRTGPSAEALKEQRNADKLVDPTAVARNAGKMFP